MVVNREPAPRGVKLSVAAVAALVLVALGGCASTPPALGYSADGAPPHVVPAVSNGKDKFYSQGQVDAAWREATWKYPQALPAGVHFPETAPPYFHPNDGTQDIYQTGMPQEFAAQYWQCAWLDVAIADRKAGDAVALAAVEKKLPLFQDLPGMLHATNVKSDDKDFAAEAKTAGMPTDTFEFQINCGFFKSFSRKP